MQTRFRPDTPGFTEVHRFGPGLDGLIKVAEGKLPVPDAGVERPLQPSISYSGRHRFVADQNSLILFELQEIEEHEVLIHHQRNAPLLVFLGLGKGVQQLHGLVEIALCVLHGVGLDRLLVCESRYSTALIVSSLRT